MTAVEEIRAMTDATISPEVASKALGCKPQSLRLQAEKDATTLGFPVCRMGRMTRIPRLPFLKWLTGE